MSDYEWKQIFRQTSYVACASYLPRNRTRSYTLAWNAYIALYIEYTLFCSRPPLQRRKVNSLLISTVLLLKLSSNRFALWCPRFNCIYITWETVFLKRWAQRLCSIMLLALFMGNRSFQCLPALRRTVRTFLLRSSSSDNNFNGPNCCCS